MGNLNSSHHTGKVVLPDGSIHEFQEPTTVAELMMDHPQQVVVELNHNLVRPTALTADTKLELNKSYLMLPLRRGRLLSFSSQDAQQTLLRVNAVLRAKAAISSSRTIRFLAKIRPLEGGEGNKVLVPKKEEKEEDLCVEMGHVSGKGWKPSLETIEEKKEGRKQVDLVVLARKGGKRIETKGLVWG